MEPMKPMTPMKPMEPMAKMQPFWPSDLGEPSSSGSQNDTRYAYFAERHRLVVDRSGQIETYDTGDHDIQGFGQQQGGGDAMTFQSNNGTVDLSSLKKAG